MIFALIDYVQYVTRRGRFGENQSSGMSLGHLNGLPKDVLDDLWPGDLILTQRLDSFLSWAMMYFTSSSIDHTAIYSGNGKVAHMTLSGFKEHRIGVLTKNSRVMPLRAAVTGESPFEMEDDKFSNPLDSAETPSSRRRLPPKWQLLWVGIRIVLGLHPDRFRAKYLADLLIAAALLDLAALWLVGLPIFLIAASIFAAASGANLLLAAIRQKRGKKVPLLAHPDLIWKSLRKHEWLMFSKLGPLVVSELGLIPLHVFRALGRESPEDGSQDKFEPLSQYVRHVIKSLDLTDTTCHSEHKRGDEDDNEEVEKSSDRRGEAGKQADTD